MGKVFGIDLGTTYSCIAYIDEFGKPTVLKNRDGDHTTPSVVYLESESNVIVGVEAKRSVEVESDKVIQFIKRKMGKENDKVVIDGKEYTAPEISAYILRRLTEDANSELSQTGVLQDGETIKDVVITCPAYFGMNERQATKTAGELAGLNVLNIINEPTAAAISYGVSGKDKSETVLVYDLGGGTFDITVMNIEGNNISVVCTGGDDTLGGKDWDECLIDYICERYQEEFGEDLADDPEVFSALYIDVENWKKALTAREKVNITVNGAGGRFREELTREKYEELTRDLLNQTKNLLNDVLSTSEKQGYPLSKIDKVLLVGGSSRMPQVAKMLEEEYHVTPVLSDPDEAVAKGAAIYAGNEKEFNDFIEAEAKKAGKTTEEIKEENVVTGALQQKFALSSGGLALGHINISNVLSRTYGMSTTDKSTMKQYIYNMLMVNEKLPTSYTGHFQTLYDRQSGVDIEIYESRSTERNMDIDERTPITTIEMRFVKEVPEGTGLEVTFELDNSGILHVKAEEGLYHSKLDTTFTLSNQLSEEEMENASKRMALANVE